MVTYRKRRRIIEEEEGVEEEEEEGRIVEWTKHIEDWERDLDNNINNDMSLDSIEDQEILNIDDNESSNNRGLSTILEESGGEPLIDQGENNAKTKVVKKGEKSSVKTPGKGRKAPLSLSSSSQSHSQKSAIAAAIFETTSMKQGGKDAVNCSKVTRKVRLSYNF